MRAFGVGCLAVCVAGCGATAPTPAEFLAMAAKGQTAKVRDAIAHGAKLSSTDQGGFCPLSMAAYNGHTETVRALLEAGANPDFGRPVCRPLLQAAAGSHREIVTILISHGAKVQYAPGEEQPLSVATDPEIIRALVEAGGDVNLGAGMQKETGLHRAAGQGAVEAVRAFIESGARVNLRNEFGWAALHFACRATGAELKSDAPHRIHETIRLLLRAGADPNLADRNASTPIHVAARSRLVGPEILRELIRAGGRLDLKNALGRTPRDVAQANGFSKDKVRLAALTSTPSVSE